MQNCNGRNAKGGPLRCKTVTDRVPKGAPPVQNCNGRSAKRGPLRCKTVTDAGPKQAFRCLDWCIHVWCPQSPIPTWKPGQTKYDACISCSFLWLNNQKRNIHFCGIEPCEQANRSFWDFDWKMCHFKIRDRAKCAKCTKMVYETMYF